MAYAYNYEVGSFIAQKFKDDHRYLLLYINVATELLAFSKSSDDA